MKFPTPAFLQKIPPTWRARIGVTLVVGTALGLLVEWVPLKQVEWLTERYRLRARERWALLPTTGDVLVLAIDEKALAVHKQWPFARSVHGQLMEWLGRHEKVRPAVMSWDFVFGEETFDPKLDLMFAAPLASTGYPIVMGAFGDPAARGLFSQGKPAPRLGKTRPLDVPPDVVRSLPDVYGLQIPIVPLLDVTRFALLDAQSDDDGVIRRLPMVIRVGDKLFPSLVLGTLMAYWSEEDVVVRPGDAVVLAPGTPRERSIPIDADGYYHLNYRYELREAGVTEGIEAISYQDIYESLASWAPFEGDVVPLPVAGRILVVGQTATGLSDIGPSPLRSQSGKVLAHINAIENILRGDYLVHWPVWPGVCVVLAFGLWSAWLLDRKRVWYFASIALFMILCVAAAWLALVAKNIMMPMAAPLVAFTLQQTAVAMLKIREEQAQRDRIRRMFGSYVSPELVRRMVDARAEPQLGGHEDEITAFFSDIQGFSAFSEILPAADLVQLLNEYLGSMTDILQESGGALDKYIGDAVVAMFGGLVPLPDHARRACESAAKMQLRQGELREKWKAQGDRWPGLVHAMRTRIGLNSGRVVVGNMGSHHRFNYTMMGDAVNLAARCESGAKTFGAYTVATGTTVSAAKAAGCECVFRALDRIVVKGRREAVEIFEIVGLSPAHLPEGAARCLELFAEGRAHYLKQEWDAAIRCFEAAAPLEPLQPERDEGVESNPSLIMGARCRMLGEHPPGAGWDGVFRMTTK
ncbi:MAG: cyaB [Rariglobus sp.]|nr:cyaB [Rariglobus sp.]